ncbi:MAG: DUF4185 domain-containing protein [Deltaproteobacteria bacterium]|nr:DUF4185 domain-containing protein [Deltaproteobacteria bacterium]
MYKRSVRFWLCALYALSSIIYSIIIGDVPAAKAQDGGAEPDGGLSELDSDNDGITDDLDACPEQAEDFDGYQDQDGCPEADAAPLCGDVTGDNRVRINDLTKVRRYLGAREGSRRYRAECDINHDGIINNIDLSIVRDQLGTRCRLAVGSDCESDLDCLETATCDASTDECRLSVGSRCDDSAFCGGNATCDPAVNQCRLSLRSPCSASSECLTTTVCDESLGECRYPLGTSCSDTSECVTSTSCDGITHACRKMADGLTALYTQYLGKFSGPSRQPLEQDLERNMFGTDLGVSYEANGRINFLFGDTWNLSDESVPVYTYGPWASDSVGWIDANQASPEPYAVPMVNFYSGISSANPNWWTPIEIAPSPTGAISLGAMEVPEGAIVLPNGDQYILFTSGWYAEYYTQTRIALGKVPEGRIGPCPDSGACVLDYVWDKYSAKFPLITPVVDHEEQVVWLFGAGPYRQGPLYLARVPIDSIEDLSRWEYFEGLTDEGPIFTPGTEDIAVGLFDESCIGEGSVVYNQALNKYFMTYNCHLEQNAPAGVHLRVADKPYGPWSDPITVLYWSDPYGKYMHQAACFDTAVFPCVTEDDGLSLAYWEGEWGGVYGPQMIPQWFKADEQAGLYEIVYTLSTHNPYQVHLIRSVLGLPGASYSPPEPVLDPPDALQNPDWSEGLAGWNLLYGAFYLYQLPTEMGITTYGIEGSGSGNFGMLTQSFRVDPGITSLSFNTVGGYSQVQLWYDGEMYRTSRGRDSLDITVPVRWNIEEFQGRTVEIRIVDNELDPNDPWGFITVGGFRLE